MKKNKRVIEGAFSTDVNNFWWRSFNNGKARLGDNLINGRKREVEAMRLMSIFYEGTTEDGPSTCKIVDYENDAVMQSIGVDFIAGHGIYNPDKRRYIHNDKMLVSVKTLANKTSFVFKKENDNGIYIAKTVWDSTTDKSSHMIAINEEHTEAYLIDTDRYKQYPELLSKTTRSPYVKINLTRGLEDDNIKDLINDKYIK